MHQGNWQCSGCSGTITELPFEPKSTNNLLCKQCFASGKGSQKPKQDPARAQRAGGRQMFSGDWKCSGCSKAITELPFQPRETSNLLCKDCFRQKQIA